MTPTPEEVLSVPCPTCGAPEGSTCAPGRWPYWRGCAPHAARKQAAESETARREEREQMQDWRNDSGV